MKISVITTTYRSGGIARMVRGFADQMFKDSELIFLDTLYDERHEKVESISKRFAVDDRVRHLRSVGIFPYNSVTEAYNDGIRVASGELVVFLSDYARMEPRCLEKHWDGYLKGRCVVGSYRWERSGKQLSLFSRYTRDCALRDGEEVHPGFWLFKNDSAPLAVIKEFGGLETSLCGWYVDTDFGMELLRHGQRLVFDSSCRASIDIAQRGFPRTISSIPEEEGMRRWKLKWGDTSYSPDLGYWVAKRLGMQPYLKKIGKSRLFEKFAICSYIFSSNLRRMRD